MFADDICKGANIQIATPVGYEPDADVLAETKRLAEVRVVVLADGKDVY